MGKFKCIKILRKVEENKCRRMDMLLNMLVVIDIGLGFCE